MVFDRVVANKKADGVNNKVLKELKKVYSKTTIWSYAVALGGTTKDTGSF